MAEKSNTILITTQHENIIEFDIKVDGLQCSEVQARIILKTEQFDINHLADRKKDKNNKDTWQCAIPPHAFFKDEETYPFDIEVIVDGYYFRPFSGDFKITMAGDVEAFNVINTTNIVQTEEVPELVIEEPEVEEAVAPKPTFEELTKKVLERGKVRRDRLEDQKTTVEETPVLDDIEATVNNIINDISADESVSEATINNEMDDVVNNIIKDIQNEETLSEETTEEPDIASIIEKQTKGNNQLADILNNKQKEDIVKRIIAETKPTRTKEQKQAALQQILHSYVKNKS